MVHIGWTLFHEAHFWPHIAAKAGQASLCEFIVEITKYKTISSMVHKKAKKKAKKEGKEGGPRHWIGYEMDTISQNCC